MIEDLVPPQFVPLADVQAGTEEELLAKDHVVGVALGYKSVGGRETDEPALSVLVDTKLDPSLLSADDIVPSTIDGSTTDVVEVGILHAGATRTEQALRVDVPANGAATEPGQLPRSAFVPTFDTQALTVRMRPAMGGCSVGHFNVTAGTIATGCYDSAAFPGIPPRFYLLSNNHVLANSNAASIGDPILQPGKADGGVLPQDVIGRLARFQPIRFHAENPASPPLNLIDAAIAEVPFQSLTREVYYIGYPKPPAQVAVGDVVQKTGRTTNYTTGRVQSVNATVDVNFGGGRVARFARQIVTTNMSAPGDSGSLVLNLDNHAVGLLFAGSSAATIMNPIAFVTALLGIRIG
ncbi:MAG TPA: trypsin-like peptidase domain-containing protein [Egibacteraceae bacterium]|jgi:hypothetical protein|nr:trypsin-like peptidase domain-containing protein [Egibacteraceae bacterium]